MHGFLLWLTLSALKSNGWLELIGLPGFCLTMALLGCVVVSLASLSYLRLERPVMKWARGKRFGRREREPLNASTASTRA